MKSLLIVLSLILVFCFSCSNKSETEKKLEKIEKEAEKSVKKIEKQLEK